VAAAAIAGVAAEVENVAAAAVAAAIANNQVLLNQEESRRRCARLSFKQICLGSKFALDPGFV
jgi:hypothetical protein